MEKETCTFSYCQRPEVVTVETDLLIIGGGMSACGAAFEATRWAQAAEKAGKGKIKITLVDKAAMDRSGAVAMGLSAINTYMGEQDPADYVRMVKGDLMGIIREDLVYDLGRHVDDSVEHFEEWGLPIWKKDESGHTMDGAGGGKKLKEGGKPVRSGKWQIMINGESYKVIVAEAAKKALGLENIYERVFITKYVLDEKEDNRIAGAIGFSVRENKVYLFKTNALLSGCGGAVNVFRPRSVAEGQGRAWYPVWNSGSGYATGAMVGAEMTMMENRFVPARFKDGYGPVGAWFLFFKAKATNAFGEDYCAGENFEEAKKLYSPYAEKLGTCIRNHMMMMDMKKGKGPILMNTDKAMAELAKTMDAKQIKHLEAEAWEDFLDMAIGQAGVWAGMDIEPDKKPSEIMPTEPYLLGSHAGCAGFWVSGPNDLGAPADWHWGYNRMSTVSGLFMMGDICGASGHKFSSGSHAEGRIAGKEGISFILDHKDFKPTINKPADEITAEMYLPFEVYEKYKNHSTAPEINPYYIKPKMLQARLQKIADEYFGGVSTYYMTSKTLLEEGLRQLALLKEDAAKTGAKDLHELLRAWENYHRIWAVETHARHILFREETRYPGYYYRGDFLGIDDKNWKCFVNSKYDPKTGQWSVFKREHVALVD
ncbi:MAG: adenylyl-sulfate reductase subunit alpha [Nitrospiraceae bacterium]|nr:adenylyl-sulfate reductase subunit alpha [Nitrospiraceae bacterium]